MFKLFDSDDDDLGYLDDTVHINWKKFLPAIIIAVVAVIALIIVLIVSFGHKGKKTLSNVSSTEETSSVNGTDADGNNTLSDKDEKEQDLMRKSSKINDIAMDKIIPWVAKGLTEKELNAKMREIYKELGCEDVSFDPITAYGHGAADPHHVTDDSKGKRGDCVILDIGGFKDNYASDMTRTVFIGEVSDRAREVYNVVLEANLRGIAAAKPGNRMCDVDLAARNYIEEKGFGEYFTHRTGHSIGLEDHEFGDVSSVNTDIIKVGQCFSVEPGIYLPDENIGVRIEDLVLITEDGCEVLNDYTKELIVVPEE